jgi:putative pyruvate formate lyase activating enzyme
MDQYYPTFKAFNYPELARRISQKEFKEAVNLAKKAGLRRLYRE